MKRISFLKKTIKLDLFLMKSSLIDSVQLANVKLIKAITSLTLLTLLTIIFVSLIQCIKNQYIFLLWAFSIQFILTSYVFYSSFKNYKRYMGYIATYGILFLTLTSEVYGILYSPNIEQRFLFTNSVLLILIFVSSLTITPMHSLYIGIASLIRIVLIDYFYQMTFLHKTFVYQLVIFSCVTVCVFLAFKKLYEAAYQTIINESIINQKNEKLNRLMDFKHDIVSTIMHDIRNPLNNILFATKETPAAQQISESVHRALQIADNFMDVHRMAEGAIVVRPTYESIYQTALCATAQVKYMMQEKNNTIQLNIANSLSLNFDKPLIERVFVNILTNSIKHALPNSLIVFNCEFLEDCVRFEIKNNGNPIHPNDIHSVFDKFYSKEEIAETAYKSKGLGLWFCKMAIDAHGGTIGLASSYPKNGTSTWFTLPHLTTFRADMPVDKEIIDLNIPLADQEKALIKRHAARLCQCEMYETGSIVKILNNIVVPNSPNVELWKDMLTNAVVKNNKVFFDELMTLLD